MIFKFSYAIVLVFALLVFLAGMYIGDRTYIKGYAAGQEFMIEDGEMHWGRHDEICWWSNLSDDGTIVGVRCISE